MSDKATSTSEGEGMDSVYAEKKALRKEIRAKIRAFDGIPEQSQMVWDRVVSLPAYQQAKTVGLFLSMPTNEIQTGFLVRHAIESSKTVYVPQVGANFEQADMELIQCPTSDPNFVTEWPTNKWKIPEPPADYERVLAQPGDLDVLIVPGLCFDQRGGRLGQGKGYYDRFIARMKQDFAKPLLVGVAMEPSLLPDDRDIPTTPLDYRMEMIVTPHDTIVIDTDAVASALNDQE